MKTKITLGTLLVVVVAMLMVLGTPRHARAKNGCSNASLQGSYGVHATGGAEIGPIAVGPPWPSIAFVGVLTFDGRGQFEGNLTLRLNSASGPITQSKVPYTGTYTVNADCTAEDTLINMLTGGSNTHELILVDHGRSFYLLVTTPGAPPIVSGEGRKQSPGESDRD
jgi:hypothetical protein